MAVLSYAASTVGLKVIAFLNWYFGWVACAMPLTTAQLSNSVKRIFIN
jgi:hypothetical protein